MPLVHTPAYGFTDPKYKNLVNSIYRNSTVACYRQIKQDDKVHENIDYMVERAKFMEKCMTAQGFPIEYTYGDSVHLSAISVALAKEHYVKQMDKRVEEEIKGGKVAASAAAKADQDSSKVKTKFLYISPKQDTGKRVVRPLWLR